MIYIGLKNHITRGRSIETIYEDICEGCKIEFEDAINIVEKYESDIILEYAGKICRYYKGNRAEFCSVLNAKSGACPENCKFCAQSAHHKTDIKVYPLISSDVALEFAKQCEKERIKKFSLVTSGRKLSSDDFKKITKIYKCLVVGTCSHICASHGELTYEMALSLKKAGVKTYHHNLETSREYFASICTTHTYDDKVNTIKNCLKAGLEICSGGIIGMGEKREDRIKMFFDLRNLGIKSIPINILSPIKGTSLENIKPLEKEEILKMYGVCRFINPNSIIRFAGGRTILDRESQVKLLKGGVNAAITGNFLTTCGLSVKDDRAIFKEAGLDITGLDIN